MRFCGKYTFSMTLLKRNRKVKIKCLVKKDIIRDQKGSALILSMLMVMMLSLIGIAATTTSTLEMGIAANERVYKDNFNRAEAAAVIGAQEIENETDETPLKDLQDKKYSSWLHFDLPYPDNLNDNWDYDDQNPDTPSNTDSAEAIDPQCRYLGDYKRVAPGASLDMSEPTVHEFSIYGRSAKNKGSVMIEIGYRKRY